MVDADLCCGCCACEQACTHHAIRMVEDALGFFVPSINANLCINCGLCDKVCPIINIYRYSDKDKFPKVFAARHKKVEEIETSRSGAVFIALSDKILKDGGVVYGAGFGEGLDFRVRHYRATNKRDRNAFKDSKYTQSDTRGIYEIVKNDLSAGFSVLFSGTPCQTAALQNFIPERLKKNLFVVDVVCHGVASPRVWNDYLAHIEHIEKCRLSSVCFRDKKKFGWSGFHRESFVFTNGRNHSYPYTFYQPFLIRRSCNRCPYASISRSSDITIGDFWGWQRVDSSLNTDDKGISLVLLNTGKGMELFKKVTGDLFIKPAAKGQFEQPNLLHPTEKSPLRTHFENDYVDKGFEFVFKKYFKASLSERIKWRIKRLLHKD